MDKIRVAVRVRPFNRREIELGSTSVVCMKSNQCILHHPSSVEKTDSRKLPKTFAFDNCFDCLENPKIPTAQQEEVFSALGEDILNNAFEGYNACILAYGQTGSGKSYTMMGSADTRGLIPRLCDSLFERTSAFTPDPSVTYKVEVSYMEIYNEKVHDLLDPKGSRQMLKVREHNILGPYVDGLSQLAVSAYEEIEQLIEEGNKARTVAATNMNSESSRSHAVFTVILTQTLTDHLSGVSGEKMSRISLVDLAGSERAVKTGAVGDRLKEGSNINKSLTTLGLVISKLADQSLGKGRVKDNFVPYRDSVLTWLLKDNLGGNSRTVMVATVSPSSDNYEETLSTLRYADRAKRIVNHAIVNEDPKAKIIRELRQEVEALREQLKANLSLKQGKGSSLEEESINEKLHASEKLITNLSETWENKLKKTERMQQERQQALEKMGISVQASGISVEKNKYYLVNLNADPCLNEMLVYYLKDRTLVGRPDMKGMSNDIQLSGVGIETHHCTLVIQNKELFLEPIPSARTFVNGSQVTDTIQLRHGDRILWGFNYFFRVNCPRSSIGGGSEPQTPAHPIDYNFAREELMLKELNNDPIQAAIQNLERQHEEDKQMALEKQRLEYEKQFQQLRNILSPTTPYGPYQLFDPIRGNKMTPSTPTSQLKIEKWAQEREDIFKRSLAQLRQDIMKANTLVKEANFFAQEMGKLTTFQVTLQIPPQNLSPNRKRSAFVSEPAILVKRKGKPSQVWSMEKLDHKLIVMREMYNDTRNDPSGIRPEADPFYESQETHNLIGVANIFLECLFHDVRLNYHIPIISQQGEVAGRLQVEICRVAGQFPQERFADTLSDSSSESGMSRDEDDFQQNSSVTCRVCIKQASGLPPSLSHFVFCQYQFWGQTEGEVVAPVVNNDYPPSSNANDSVAFKFEHAKNYVTSVSEDFIEHCSEGALSIEVWGHRSAGFGIAKPGWEVDHQLAKARSLIDRWKELTRKIEFWVEIQELGECGEYVSVEVTPQKDCLTGGVYQLRQGQQRRVVCRVKPVANSGTLPLICEAITSINIGSICGRIQCQRQLDSYTEEDLNVLREKWSDALQRRRMYLDHQIQKIINKDNKSERDSEREQSLVDQWVSLTEERNAVLVPAPGSNVPGAPADWDPPSGMEVHVPVVFLDLNADDFSAQCNGDLLPFAGTNAIIPKENCNKFFPLQIIKCYEKDVCAVASWDSSIHDNIHLNRITQSDERVYLVVKAVVRLSHPAPMDIVLRKRISVNIYKKQSFTSKIVKSIIGSYNTLYDSGVMYEVVSNIPKASEELEDRESLAKMAANADDCNEEDGETYIEKYTKGVTSVESILMLDRLRQSVAVKELLQTSGRPLMRKTASVPNFSQLFGSFDEGLDVVARSGSVMDLNAQLNCATTPQSSTPQEKLKHRYPVQGPSRPTFLNLNVNLNSLRQQGPTSKSSASPSPGPVKMAPRMTTLHEESHPRDSNLVYHMEEDEEVEEEDDVEEEEIEERNSEINDEEFYCEMSNYRRVGSLTGNRLQLTQSRTLDSLNEVAVMKASTPSTVSSGYGSGAVSSTTLSEDSLSIRSVSVDETPEKDMPVIPLTSSDLPLASSDLSVISSGESDSSDTKTVINQQLETLHISEEENSTPEAIKETVSSAEFPESKETSFDSIQDNHSDVSTKESNNNKFSNEFPSSNSLSALVSTNEVIRRTVKGNSNTSHRRSVPAFNSPSMINGVSNGYQSVTSPLSTSSNKATSSNNVPDWCVIGESVQLRPTNYSGIISYIGPTDFANGTWIGVELDLPMGKHDGSIDGVRYFNCRPKCGMFVRPDKIILDRRGRAMRSSKNNSSNSQGSSSGHMKRSRSSADRLSDVGAVRNANKSDVASSLRRSKSRGEGLSSLSSERSRSTNARYRKF